MSKRSEPVVYLKVIPRGSKGVRVDTSNRILGWAFDDNESKADKLALTIDNWDLVNFDSPVWEKGNELEFSFGYVGNMSPTRKLIVKSVKGSTRLTIEAFGKEYAFDRFKRCRTFEGGRRSDAVRRIAEENGFGDNAEIEDTEKVFDILTQARQTDAQFVRRMAAKEGFEFYVDFDGFHFHPRRVGQRPIKSLTWYTDNVGQIQTFNIENDISRQPSRVVTRGRDPLKKKSFQVDVDSTKDFSPTLAPTADQVAIGKAVADGLTFAGEVFLKGYRATPLGAIGEVLTTSEKDKPAAERKAKGRARKRRQLTVKMKMQIVGDPQLIAKTVVRVEGIGNRLSGNYYVKSHKHTGGSGLNGTLELIRDGKSENRKSDRLFAGGLGGGGKGCLGKVSSVRKAIRQLIAVSAAETKKAAVNKSPISSDSKQRINATTRQLTERESQLKAKRKATEFDPILKDIVREASNFLKGAAGFPPSNKKPLQRAGQHVITAGKAALTACSEEAQAKINQATAPGKVRGTLSNNQIDFLRSIGVSEDKLPSGARSGSKLRDTRGREPFGGGRFSGSGAGGDF